jgi:hypothetical protein
MDCAIALESMTSKRYGEKQGKELARLLAYDATECKIIESEHERFRAAREAIVHDGVIPPDARNMAQTGRDLVRRAYRQGRRPTGLLVTRQRLDQPLDSAQMQSS